jgi:hypothetical protein
MRAGTVQRWRVLAVLNAFIDDASISTGFHLPAPDVSCAPA